MTPPLFGDPRLPIRLWDKITINPVTGCWECQLKPDKSGYCRTTVKVDGKWKHVLVHRWTYQALIGPIPEETLNHRCLNTICCYPVPSHAGDPMSLADNLRDANARVFQCPRGHLYDYANTFMHDGRRECRQCIRDRTAAWRLVNPEKSAAVTKASNDKRAAARAAAKAALPPPPVEPPATHCPKGHEWPPEGAPAGSRTSRGCKQCQRDNTAAWRLANPERAAAMTKAANDKAAARRAAKKAAASG